MRPNQPQDTPPPRSGPVLILGGTGFVGGHLSERLEAAGVEARAAGRTAADGAAISCDVLDPASIAQALEETEPAAIVNLAGFASVGASFADPMGCFQINASGALNLLEAVRKTERDPYVLCISSGEVYGAPGEDRLPASEQLPPDPRSPYAASKAAMELICSSYAHRGLRIGVVRAFNHTGPGQSGDFIASSFARQIAERSGTGERPLRLEVGDLSPVRDISDVRDVATAYRLMVSGEVEGTFNVCSGRAIPLERIVEVLAEAADVEVRTDVAPERLRPVDVPILFGSPEKLTQRVGWRPELPFEQTMRDLYEWWKARI